MVQFTQSIQIKIGDLVSVISHNSPPIVVNEMTADYVSCTLPDGTSYRYPHYALELVTPDASREVKATSGRRIPYGAVRFDG
jgi:hypothetical protein